MAIAGGCAVQAESLYRMVLNGWRPSVAALMCFVFEIPCRQATCIVLPKFRAAGNLLSGGRAEHKIFAVLELLLAEHAEAFFEVVGLNDGRRLPAPLSLRNKVGLANG
jgi:hypothetical protein